MSEHIGADEAQALLDAATPGPWEAHNFFVLSPHPSGGSRRNVACNNEADAALIAAAPRLAAEVVRLRRELDARTDQPTADELQAALNVQFDAPAPVPAHWQPIQQAAYRDGWLDAMQRVKDSTDTAAAARLLGGGE